MIILGNSFKDRHRVAEPVVVAIQAMQKSVEALMQRFFE